MIEIVHIGLGPLGQMMVKSAVARRGFRVVGAVDTDPAKIGRDLVPQRYDLSLGLT